MDSIGLYEPKMLSLFGEEQLLGGLGSLLEPDSPTYFPLNGDHNQLDLLGFAQDKTSDNVVNSAPQDISTGLDLGWMDTRLDLFDLVNDEPAVDVLTPLTVDTTPQVKVSVAADLFHQIEDSTVPEIRTERDILSEVLLKLSDYISRDDVDPCAIPDLGNDVLSPVSINDIESLLSESDQVIDLNDSGLGSLLSPQSMSATSSRPDSPDVLEYMHVDPDLDGYMQDQDYIPSEIHQHKQTKASKSRKSKTAPYKYPTDRKERKKMQNKTAALKYRQKKKNEAGTVTSELDLLEERNHVLKDKADSLAREIQYLKDLMGEVLKAKGTKS